MHDLHLWRQLQAPALRPAVLRPLLEELAALPLYQRMPFFGLLPRALRHADAGLRAAAVAALADATGSLAFRHLIAALDDDDATVRRAAVEALRHSSTAGDYPRWVHALLHPDAVVRRAAVSGDNPYLPDTHLLYVLPDPECAPLVVPKLEGQILNARQLPLVFDLAAQGCLPLPLARRLAASAPWLDVLHGMTWAARRGSEQVLEILDGDRPGEVTFHDEWDRLLGLFWDEGQGGEPDSSSNDLLERFFKLAQEPPSMSPHRQRVLASVAVTAARRGLPGTWSAQLAAAFHPRLLGSEWLPLESRRAGVRALYRLGDRCPRCADDEVRRLIESDLCRRTSGSLDLWAVGGVLHLLERHPYRLLQDWAGKDRVVDSFLEDVDDSAAMLCLRDESPRGRNYLIREIVQRNFADRPRLLARLALAVRPDGLDFLDHLDGRGACQVAGALLTILAPPTRQPSPRRTNLLASLLGKKIAAGHAGEFLRGWLRHDAPEEMAFAIRLLGTVARAVEPRVLVPMMAALEPELLRKCLTATAWCPGFPYETEAALAQALVSHPEDECRRWALRRLPPAESTAAAHRLTAGRKTGKLAPASMETIARCPEEELAEVLRDCKPGLKVGLCEALAHRPDPAEPRLDVCLLLLACHDPVGRVLMEFQRFASEESAFLARLDAEMLDTWRGEAQLPLLGHAWLSRWEVHGRGLGERLASWPGGAVEALRCALGWPVRELARQTWQGFEMLTGVWRYRERERLAEIANDAFGDLLLDGLRTAQADSAAQMLMRLLESGVAATLLARLRVQALPRMGEVPESARRILRGWIDTTGMSAAPAPTPPPAAEAPAEPLGEVLACTDLDRLEAWCRGDRPLVASLAAERLIDLGDGGAARVAKVLRDAPPSAVELARLLQRYPRVDVLDDAWAVLESDTVPGEARFRLGLGLATHHRNKVLPHLFAAVCEETAAPWFMQDHWDALLALGVSSLKLAASLASSPQPTAYTLAVNTLLSNPTGAAARQALLAFLECGTDRLRELRVQVARQLAGKTDAVFPILLQEEGRAYPVKLDLLAGLDAPQLDAVVTAVLTAGHNIFNEEYLITFLNDPGVDADLRDSAYRRLLLQATNIWVRQESARQVEPTSSRDRLLRRVAGTFAWGVQTARALTGKLFGVEMIGGEDLGYTRFEQNKVYINPLPMVRGEMNGREVVEGLIVHELGHHMYHRGEAAQKIWATAASEGLHPLLNLVSDEHLERNLRAKDAEHGDRLKRLCAYAFQHSQREILVETLLDCLQGRAFAVLTASRLGPARRWGCVVIDSGHILHEIEKSGLSFARFLRALRMGLGNRHADPLVAEGLALFRGKFRRSTMPELMTIAKRLREIFGWQTDILNALGQDGILIGESGECDGISNQEVQDAMRRVLEGRKTHGPRSSRGAGGTGLNLNADEHFNEIHEVIPVTHDPAAHVELARQVARPAAQLRRYFDKLGLTLEPQRFRAQGKSFDRSRAQALVLRGEPRVLIARQTRVRTDLFVGVAVDCSGSMGSGDRMHKAKLFATLLAEAARSAPGIDLRIFGFTDRVIYDAGTAQRCAAHGLYADGGNNDAAGLWHAAQAARSSRRKAKLLVMISDGLPTECTVAALQGLVGRLTRRMKMCCAQVAVHPLEVVCFPHYVLLDEADLPASVRRFGNVIVRLVQKALRG